LIDYDESLFTGVVSLTVETRVGFTNSTAMRNSVNAIDNYDSTGVIQIPVDLTEKQKNGRPKYIVYHLDDMLPGRQMLSSFSGYEKPAYIAGSRWIGGVEQNHGNAIDISFYTISDPDRRLILAPEDMTLMRARCNYKSDTNLTSCNYFFALPVSAIILVDSSERYVTCKLELLWSHLTVSQHDMPDYYSVLYSRRWEEIPAGTPLGVMESRGGANAEIHIGVYCPKCVDGTGCDAYWPANDPISLILPAAMFFSPPDRDLIFESMLSTRKK